MKTMMRVVFPTGLTMPRVVFGFFLLTACFFEPSVAQQPKSLEERMAKLGVPPWGTGYNAQTAPNDFTKTLEVLNFVLLDDIVDIDEKTGSATLQITLMQYWQDDRLSYSSNDMGVGIIRLHSWNTKPNLLTTLYHPSVVNLHFRDYKSQQFVICIYSKENEGINRDKNIRGYEMYEGTYRQHFNLMSFPFDTQRIRWLATSVHCFYEKANGRSEMKFKIDPISVKKCPRNARWDIVNTHSGSTVHEWVTGNKNDLIAADIIVSRIVTTYLLKSIIPLILIVMASGLSFWIAPEAVPARTGFGVTMVLVGVAQAQTISKDLPQISYMTWMDAFGFLSTLYLASNLIIYAIVHDAVKSKDQERGIKIDKTARLWYPVSYVIIVIVSLISILIVGLNDANAPMSPITIDS